MFLINSALLYLFLANLLAQNQKMSEKSVFRNDVTIIASLLVLVLRFCTPPEVKFDTFDTLKYRQGKSLSKYLFCYSTFSDSELVNSLKNGTKLHCL